MELTSGTSREVRANGIRLHLLEHGPPDAPAIFVVPGITSPAITWAFVAEALAGDFRVLTLDVRGRGLSDAPPAGYTLPDYAADVAGAIDALGLERPIVLGHSMGGRIATACGALHPERCGPLLIADPPVTGPGRPAFSTPLEFYLDSIALARAGATAEQMRPYFPTWSDEALALRARWLATCDPHAVAETHRLFGVEDFLGYWRHLVSPLLFLWGTASTVVSAADVEDVQKANPAAEIRALPGAGHMLPWDDLAGFLAEVRRFLARAVPAR